MLSGNTGLSSLPAGDALYNGQRGIKKHGKELKCAGLGDTHLPVEIRSVAEDSSVGAKLLAARRGTGPLCGWMSQKGKSWSRWASSNWWVTVWGCGAALSMQELCAQQQVGTASVAVQICTWCCYCLRRVTTNPEVFYKHSPNRSGT